MSAEYVPDRLYARLMQPWTLPESEWPECKEDWSRVDAVCALPWRGTIIDFGSGDGTLAAMVCSRNPSVVRVWGVEQDDEQSKLAASLWTRPGWPVFCGCIATPSDSPQSSYDGALCCEVLEHLTPEEGRKVLCDLKRVMRPGAMLCVTVPKPDGTRWVYPGHITPYNTVQIAHAVKHAGFKGVQVSLFSGGVVDNPWIYVVANA